MTQIEFLLSKRELSVFIGVENHSTPYNPLLFNKIWELPDSLPSKDLLIMPINGLGEPYMLSKEKVMCNGRSLWVLFVESPSLVHYAFLFDTFPQTDENNYFTDECIQFLQKSNCCSVAVCDIGVYKSRSLVNLLNYAISSLGKYNMSVCLATILGYNSRGYTDIETEDEKSKYKKEYYLRSDIEAAVVSDSFYFIQIERWFNMFELFKICCQTKSPAEVKLQEIKEQAKDYRDSLKPLWDAGFFRIFITSLDKGDSFDFDGLDNKLKECGFKGELVDANWCSKYDELCSKIRRAKQNDRGFYVQDLISAIDKNIKSTINFVKLI